MGFHLVTGRRRREGSPESTLLKVDFSPPLLSHWLSSAIIAQLKAESEQRIIINRLVICLLLERKAV